MRNYLHDAEEAAPFKQAPGTFTPWERRPATAMVDVARLAGLQIAERRNKALMR